MFNDADVQAAVLLAAFIWLMTRPPGGRGGGTNVKPPAVGPRPPAPPAPWRRNLSPQTRKSEMTDDQAIEQKVQAANCDAPRLTPQDLDDNIKHVEYVVHTTPSGQVMRWCVLTTNCGFGVTGKPSVAVSPENDRPLIGQEVAYANARKEMWALMGYALKDWIARKDDYEKLASASD